MSKLFIKKSLIAAALSLTLSLQLVAPVFAATNEEILGATQAGVDYLADNQSADGGVVSLSDVTDWAVVAVAANGQDPAEFKNGGDSAIDYLTAHPVAPAAPATDVEKRILAIAAAGEDSTDFDGVDYNALLLTQHNNDQIGSPTLLNDDMFGIIAAAAADDPALQTMAQDGLDYLIAHQDVSGGFSYTTDTCAYCGVDSNDTAAAIIAMQAAEALSLTNSDLAEAQNKALVFLLSTQQADGGFAYDLLSPSDGSSTAWGLMALNSIGDSVAEQALKARDWLLANQNDDGGFSYGAYGYTDSDAYTTAHAVIALLGSTWLLQPEPLRPTTPPVTETPAPTPTPTAVLVTYSSTPQTTTPASTPTTQATTAPETVLSETTPAPEKPVETPAPVTETPAETKTANKKPNYALFGAAILLLVAVIWYVLQSKSEQGEK